MEEKLKQLEEDINTVFGRTEGLRMLLQLLLMYYFTSTSLLQGKEVAEVLIREFRENVERNKALFKNAPYADETKEGFENLLELLESAARDFRRSDEEAKR